MKRTTSTLLAGIAIFALADTASARHDDGQHGVSKATALAVAQAQASKPVYIGVGPRAHDSPLRYVAAERLRQSRTPVTSTPR